MKTVLASLIAGSMACLFYHNPHPPAFQGVYNDGLKTIWLQRPLNSSTPHLALGTGQKRKVLRGHCGKTAFRSFFLYSHKLKTTSYCESQVQSFWNNIPLEEKSMKSHRKELWFNIPSRRGFVNITREVEAAIRESGVKEGLVLVNASLLHHHL